MTAELYKEIEGRGACVDLSARAKFRLTGADRVRYLNGQVTNDVRKASATVALHACVTNAKGRIEGDVFMHAPTTEDALYLDAEPGLREPLALRLEKYIVADDVTLEDVTDAWRLVHVFGASAMDDAWPTELGEGIRQVRTSRFGEDGVDLWIPAPSPVPHAPCPVLSAEDAETLRIVRGIPSWPHELNAQSFPQEAGLESSAMDFQKGCYIGQEVLSRIKTTGKMPQRLVRFTVAGWTAQQKRSGPAVILVREEDGSLKAAGAVTSLCTHPVLDRMAGLAYVRHGLGLAHSLLLADADPPAIVKEIETATS